MICWKLGNIKLLRSPLWTEDLFYSLSECGTIRAMVVPG